MSFSTASESGDEDELSDPGTPVLAQAATAADLPEELFARILDYAPDVDMTKHDLGMCALVCTYWAEQVQPQIFRHIVLRCAEDVRTLNTFFESEYSRVAEFIEDIRLEETGTQEPWLHLVSILLVPKQLGFSLSLSVNMEHATSESPSIPTQDSAHHRTPTTPSRFRSLLASLPRAIPALLGNIYDLDLFKITFRKFADFAYLVGELPELRALKCEQLTWPEHNVALPSPARLPKQLGSVVVVECPDYWSFIWLFIGPNRLPPRMVPKLTVQPLNLSQDDRMAVGQVLKLYREVVVEALLAFHHSVEDYYLVFTEPIDDEGDEADEDPKRVPDLNFTFSEAPQAPEPSIATRREIIPSHVTVLTVDFHAAPLERFCACDWKAFDTIVSSLPRLRKVVFGFITEEDALKFGQQYGDDLVRLSGENKMRYASWSAEREEWVRWKIGGGPLETTAFLDQI